MGLEPGFWQSGKVGLPHGDSLEAGFGPRGEVGLELGVGLHSRPQPLQGRGPGLGSARLLHQDGVQHVVGVQVGQAHLWAGSAQWINTYIIA